tara:strand:+ start:82 stop:357 length:276 start_codon:yes stop_codon:yes gene_type:complete
MQISVAIMDRSSTNLPLWSNPPDSMLYVEGIASVTCLCPRFQCFTCEVIETYYDTFRHVILSLISIVGGLALAWVCPVLFVFVVEAGFLLG